LRKAEKGGKRLETHPENPLKTPKEREESQSQQHNISILDVGLLLHARA
jgi:hypothetical protein